MSAHICADGFLNHTLVVSTKMNAYEETKHTPCFKHIKMVVNLPKEWRAKSSGHNTNAHSQQRSSAGQSPALLCDTWEGSSLAWQGTAGFPRTCGGMKGEGTMSWSGRTQFPGDPCTTSYLRCGGFSFNDSWEQFESCEPSESCEPWEPPMDAQLARRLCARHTR